MRNWKARLSALLTAVAMLLAVSGSAAMADDGDWDDDYSGYGYYGWYYYPYYYYGADDSGDDWGDD